MSWHYSTDVSRGGDPYPAAEPDFSDDHAGAVDDDGEDYDAFVEPDSGRWRWVAAVAGVVLLIAVVGTIVIVTGGDSASTTARIVPSESRPVFRPPPPKPSPPTSLPPETVTTLRPSTPSPSTAEAAPSPVPSPGPSPSETAPPADSQTVIYTVSGTKQPFDPVTVTYTDETGALRTDFDVSLPWSRKLARNANVLVDSVTAVSFASHLNCTISDGNGQMLVSQNYNTIAATCNR
jgi:hypothetical protein